MSSRTPAAEILSATWLRQADRQLRFKQCVAEFAPDDGGKRLQVASARPDK